MEILTHSFQIIFGALEILIVTFFMISCIYVFIFSVAGHLYKKQKNNFKNDLNRIAVFIPAYKEDAVIVDVAKSALLQQYPPSLFDIIIIADSLRENTLRELGNLRVNTLEVSFKNSTKAKALNMAMAKLNKHYDYAVVLDADNIMEPEFLNKINSAFMNGYLVVQGHRKAKNLNSPFAILDAASEEINNHIFRRGHRALGLSSGLIGSGMAFKYDLFKSIMKCIKAVGGFDKELEFELAKRNIAIEYLQKAIVLDEKIQEPSEFSNQRRRWLATQFIYLKKYFITGISELVFRYNINFFDKMWQMIIPPRILLLGVTLIMSILYCMKDIGLGIQTNVSYGLWLFNLMTLIVAFLLALPKSFYSKHTFKALLSLPTAFVRMTLLLFRLKGANKKFIHTTHNIIKN